jgi:hypothetical protein
MQHNGQQDASVTEKFDSDDPGFIQVSAPEVNELAAWKGRKLIVHRQSTLTDFR